MYILQLYKLYYKIQQDHVLHYFNTVIPMLKSVSLIAYSSAGDVASKQDMAWVRMYVTRHLKEKEFGPVLVVVVYPLPWPLLVGGVRCSRLWSTSQLLRPSGQQCSHSGGVCPQIQGRQCGAYVGAVEEMMCVVCVDVTEGA